MTHKKTQKNTGKSIFSYRRAGVISDRDHAITPTDPLITPRACSIKKNEFIR